MRHDRAAVNCIAQTAFAVTGQLNRRISNQVGPVKTVNRATSANLSPVGETQLIKTHGIADRRRVVAISYMMLGVSIILPWAMFSTANSFYVNFKLKSLLPSWANSTQPLSRLTEYRNFFINYLGIVIHTPDTFAPVIILLFVAKADNRPRILKLSGCLVYFNFTIMVLALVDSRSWPEINICTTFLVFLALGATSGSLMSFIWASTTDLRGLEVWINLGISIGGILPALASIFAKAYAIRDSASYSKEDLTASEYLDAAHLYYMISQVKVVTAKRSLGIIIIGGGEEREGKIREGVVPLGFFVSC